MIRFRPTRPQDISPCVQFVADHPVLGPRYGTAIAQLGEMWLHFLDSEALFSIVSEEIGSGVPSLIGSHTACFVSDDFATAMATRPLKWIGPELVNHFVRGSMPLLTDSEVRRANSTDGMNILVWPTAARGDFEDLSELLQESQALFFDKYRGYKLKRLQAQASDPAEIAVAVNSGGWCLRDSAAVHSRILEQPPESVVLQPHILEATREMVAKNPGAWLSLLFSYQKPTIGFSPGEQRLLSAVLQGGTDKELAKTLNISLSTAKKVWASIYSRVHSRKPSDLEIELDGTTGGNRGKEKKQKLLAYLREHPEELKPYSLKLVDKGL